MVEGLSTGSYCASESNRYFAWVDSANQYSSNTIKVMDLKSGKTFEVKKGDDQYLRPLGFIGEDFIYGQANAADVVSDAAGNTTFPMNGLLFLIHLTSRSLRHIPLRAAMSRKFLWMDIR